MYAAAAAAAATMAAASAHSHRHRGMRQGDEVTGPRLRPGPGLRTSLLMRALISGSGQAVASGGDSATQTPTTTSALTLCPRLSANASARCSWSPSSSRTLRPSCSPSPSLCGVANAGYGACGFSA